jgi:hypothetical protein
MIVRKSKLGLHILFHEAHAMLAAKIANEIKHDLRPMNWFETLISICEHDDQQLSFEETNYLSKLGVPLDFTEDTSSVNDVLKRIKRVIRRAVNKSSWVRLMISYHIDFLYADLRSDSIKIDEFLSNEEKERKIVLKNYGISNDKGLEVYQYLLFCDRLSLILCKDETPSLGRSLEINKTIGKQQYMIQRNEKDELIVSPWIFEKNEFELTIEERLIEKTSFKSSREFEETLMKTSPHLITFKLIKS